MSRTYTLTTFLRQTPRRILGAYFAHRDIFHGWDVGVVKRDHVGDIVAAIGRLDEAMRARIDADFHAIFTLADPMGAQLIADEARDVGVDLVPLLSEMKNHYHRAMWLFLNPIHGGVDLFERCHTFHQLHEHTFSESHRRRGLAQCPPRHDETTLRRLCDAVREIYRPQGRGERCKVEHLVRFNPTRHYFLAWPEDYSTSDLRYEGDDLTRLHRRPVLSLVYIFHPEEGLLELSAAGSRKEVRALQEVFCRIALGMERMPELGSRRAFELNGLKQPSFAFTTDPDDNIDRVDVVAMKLAETLHPQRRITFEDDPARGDGLHAWMERAVDRSRLPPELLDVVQTRLRVTFKAPPGRAPRTLTFGISTPDVTTLRDEPHHLLIKRYLRRWQIAA